MSIGSILDDLCIPIAGADHTSRLVEVRISLFLSCILAHLILSLHPSLPSLPSIVVKEIEIFTGEVRGRESVAH
jgi:hypothetical protein